MGQALLQQFKRDKVLSKRHIKLWANDINGIACILPYFIAENGLQPPFEVVDLGDIEKAARFVSLVPFKLDHDNFTDVPDSFMNCQQFIDMKGGDFEEHAALLCNYFIYIDKQLKNDYRSYIILGHAVPEGETYYVLRRDTKNNKSEIWNPQTGEPFYMSTQPNINKFLGLTIGQSKQTNLDEFDQACPLYDVGCVFNKQNIYINIQKAGAPDQIDWDIENPKLWKPFLEDQVKQEFFKAGIPSRQDPLKYEETDSTKVDRLEKSIEDLIKSKIEHHRNNMEIRDDIILDAPYDERQKKRPTQSLLTQFVDSSVSDTIKNLLLKQLESIRYRCRISGISSDLLGDGKNKQKEAIKELQEQCKNVKEKIARDQHLYGFPLNMSFTDYEKIWQEVKATEIQDIMDTNFKYIVAVECFKYKSYITSVWVFIGLLYDREVFNDNQEILNQSYRNPQSRRMNQSFQGNNSFQDQGMGPGGMGMGPGMGPGMGGNNSFQQGGYNQGQWSGQGGGYNSQGNYGGGYSSQYGQGGGYGPQGGYPGQGGGNYGNQSGYGNQYGNQGRNY